MNDIISFEKELIFDKKFVAAYYLKTERCIICEALSTYIPTTQFQEAFNELAVFISNNSVEKFIFDKRTLKVFDQNAMSWYHTEWKEQLLEKGLKTYRKLLPLDNLFRKSVEIGLQKIKTENPHFRFENYDIQYVENLEEAVRN